MIIPRKQKKLYPCTDGTLSTHQRRGACNWHGGLKKKKKALIIGRGRGCNEKTDVQFIDLEKISVAHEWFQNRAAIILSLCWSSDSQ